MAFDRVAKRVSEGGHNIPIDVIERRYYRGINNLVNLYIPVCDKCIVVDNRKTSEIIIEFENQLVQVIINSDIWKTIVAQGNDNKY
jgi:predicted ABC-type ATPase